MDRMKGIFSSFLNAFSTKKNKKKKPVNPVFAVSGDKRNNNSSLEELIASWKAQPDAHTRIFSSKELVRATGNFKSKRIVHQDDNYTFYKGFFGKQPVLIKKFKFGRFFSPFSGEEFNICDMVVASQLSDHGSSLKLIGFCKQLEAQVYEYEGDDVKFLPDDGFELLPWRNRLSIAHDIAKALVILHTSFSTPVIFRDLKPSKILVDESGVAKLLDFSLCRQIPESQLDETVRGTHGFMELRYWGAADVLNEKVDVFSFGVILLVLLTGQKAVEAGPGEKSRFLYEWAQGSVKQGKLKNFVDPRLILHDDREFVRREDEFRAFAALALKCTRGNRNERPQMVDVAAELARIQGFAT